MYTAVVRRSTWRVEGEEWEKRGEVVSGDAVDAGVGGQAGGDGGEGEGVEAGDERGGGWSGSGGSGGCWGWGRGWATTLALREARPNGAPW